MWKALKYLYQNRNDHKKLVLKEKLRKIKMERGDMIQKNLTKFTQCRDELGSVGVMVALDDLVNLTLLGLPKSWHSYQDSVNGRDKLLDWERLWSDLAQEEIWQSTRDRSSSKTNDDYKCALDGKAKKVKWNVSHSKSYFGQAGNKRNFSKVKCFHFPELGHYTSKCSHKKTSKKSS